MMRIENGHGGDVFTLPQSQQERLLDFSININPAGMSPKGKAAMLSHLEMDIERYPDVACRGIRQALSVRYGVPMEGITCGNGATELIYAFIRAFRPKVVCVPAPAFSEYRLAAEAEGVPVTSFLLEKDAGFQLGDSSFLENLAPGSLVFLGNPNNPDGLFLSRSAFHQVMAAVEKSGSWLMIDESFIDFAGDDRSFRQEVAHHPGLVICLSLTKFYAVPGLRIGAVFSSAAIADRLASVLYPWHVNGPVQRYMAAAVLDTEYAAESRRLVAEERLRMMRRLEKLPGIRVYPGTVNFLLLRLLDGSVSQLADALLAKHIMIRQCGNYEGLDASFFRVAVRKKEENDYLLESLQEVLVP